MEDQQISAIVLAAGEGTRMRSSMPKVLHPIAGRSLIEHAVRSVSGIKPNRLAVVIGHGKDAVGEHLTQLSETLEQPITLAVQEQQLGTGHAVRCALEMLPSELSGTVLVTYGDVPLLDTATLAALLAEHRERGNAATVLSAVPEDPTGYGRILRTAAGEVTGIVEHKDCDQQQLAITEINSGVYAFDVPVLSAALAELSTDNATGELYLTDVLSIAVKAGRPVGALVVDDSWLVEGVNDRVQLARLGAEYNRRLVEHWMRAGVTMIDPGSTWLDAGVTLGQDVVLEPGVTLRGRTIVGEGARIGPDTTLSNVDVGAAATVVRTHGSDSLIGSEASVGPFAYLRPGTELGEQAKAGAFVEVKNSRIGTGSKVPHLSYIGDATIGEHSNIGCASVTVNYDGVAKHHTVIGSHCKIGCDTMLVAPVTIGDGAYSGAGSVIRSDVPPGALAFSAGVQHNVEGWVVDRRPETASAEAAERAGADGKSGNERHDGNGTGDGERL